LLDSVCWAAVSIIVMAKAAAISKSLMAALAGGELRLVGENGLEVTKAFGKKIGHCVEFQRIGP
jgi:hypothetical protein